MTRALAVLPWLLLAVAAGDWLGLRSGRLAHAPVGLAALIGLALLAFLARLAFVAWTAARRSRGPFRGLGEALALAGVVVALGGGMANWGLGLSGTVVLHESQALPLSRGQHLEAFRSGPLARLAEMEVELTLIEVELLGTREAGFHPTSRLKAQRRGAEPELVVVDTAGAAKLGSLRLHQGAFGFSPQVVVMRDGAVLLDETVPFESVREGPSGLSFQGRFVVESEDVTIDGRVDLGSLDESLRGHPTLVLVVRHGDRVLGRGKLRLGHFAELDEGWRVGFVGLPTWSEIIIARRKYSRVVLAGTGALLAGLALWPLAAWRGW